MKSLSELQQQREKLVKKREIERRVADQATISEAQRLLVFWKEKMAQSEAGGASILLLEQQLAAAKANHQRSLNYHSQHLRKAEENLRLALVGETKKTRVLSAEIEILDKEIALAKARETGDTSEIDSIIQEQVEKSKKLLGEMASVAPAPPPPPAVSASAPPPPPALSEEEEEAKRLAAKAAAIAEDKEATKAAQNNPIHKIFPGATLVQQSKKKQPRKATSAAELGL